MNKIKNKISLLDYSILVILIIFFSIVYFYSAIIWPREEKFKELDRSRMIRIDNAQKLYYTLTNDYLNDPSVLFALIEAVRDTLDGDELFEGKKNVVLANKFRKYTIKHRQQNESKIDTIFVDDSEAKSFEFSEGIKLYANKIISNIDYLINFNTEEEEEEEDEIFLSSNNIDLNINETSKTKSKNKFYINSNYIDEYSN